MNGRYKAYGEYKESGVEWCNKLPLKWKGSNLRWLSYIYAGGTPSKNILDYWENGIVPWINSGAVNQGYVVTPSTYISKVAFENSSAKWIPKDSLVVALAGQGKTKGMVAQLRIDTTCNQSMAAIVFKKSIHSRYVFWWLRSNYQNIRNMSGGDLRDGLNLEILGDIQCPLPSDDECFKISIFLDHETAKIDTLIDKQQQLIELLKEKRQAVISHAVTKGLDPDVPMKDSGVEWLGEVPEHWKITSTKYVAILNPNKSELKINNMLNLCSFVSMEKIKLDSLVLDEDKTMIEVFNGYTYFRNDDVLMAKVTPCFENKNMVIANNLTNGIGFGTSEIYVLRCKSNLNKEYFLYRIQEDNFMEMAIAAMTGAGGLKRVPAEMLNSYLFAMPQYHEQAKIADFLDIKISKINEMLGLQQQQIELLKERRTALISAAVTGKIDVRDWQVPVTQTESDEVMA